MRSFFQRGGAARRAIQLDPNLADGYFALSRLHARRGKYLLAEEAFSKGFEIDPNYALGLNNYSSLLAVLGRLREALAMKQQVVALEPYVPLFKGAVAEVMWLSGQDDAAITILKGTPAGAGGQVALAEIYASMGRYSEAADILLAIPSMNRGVAPELVAEPARLLRTAPRKAPSPQSLPNLGAMGFIYLHLGAPDRILERRAKTAEAGYYSAGGIENAFLWHPSYAAIRKTEGFKKWVRAEGMVDYWRAKGWPEFCRPVGAAHPVDDRGVDRLEGDVALGLGGLAGAGGLGGHGGHSRRGGHGQAGGEKTRGEGREEAKVPEHHDCFPSPLCTPPW